MNNNNLAEPFTTTTTTTTTTTLSYKRMLMVYTLYIIALATLQQVSQAVNASILEMILFFLSITSPFTSIYYKDLFMGIDEDGNDHSTEHQTVLLFISLVGLFLSFGVIFKISVQYVENQNPRKGHWAILTTLSTVVFLTLSFHLSNPYSSDWFNSILTIVSLLTTRETYTIWCLENADMNEGGEGEAVEIDANSKAVCQLTVLYGIIYILFLAGSLLGYIIARQNQSPGNVKTEVVKIYDNDTAQEGRRRTVGETNNLHSIKFW